ncbi:hypothetical protein ACXZ9C_11700 [Streptococcus agalactiae]
MAFVVGIALSSSFVTSSSHSWHRRRWRRLAVAWRVASRRVVVVCRRVVAS